MSIQIVTVDFKVEERAAANIPRLKEILKDEIKDLDIGEDKLEFIIALAYREGFKDAVQDFKKILTESGVTILGKDQ